jgi:hypothetical protein
MMQKVNDQIIYACLVFVLCTSRSTLFYLAHDGELRNGTALLMVSETSVPAFCRIMVQFSPVVSIGDWRDLLFG